MTSREHAFEPCGPVQARPPNCLGSVRSPAAQGSDWLWTSGPQEAASVVWPSSARSLDRRTVILGPTGQGLFWTKQAPGPEASRAAQTEASPSPSGKQTPTQSRGGRGCRVSLWRQAVLARFVGRAATRERRELGGSSRLITAQGGDRSRGPRPSRLRTSMYLKVLENFGARSLGTGPISHHNTAAFKLGYWSRSSS